MAAITFLLGFIAVITAALYLFVKHKHGYLERRGIKHDKPNIIFGNLGCVSVPVLRKRLTFLALIGVICPETHLLGVILDSLDSESFEVIDSR